jgi:hypothetical protein
MEERQELCSSTDWNKLGNSAQTGNLLEFHKFPQVRRSGMGRVKPRLI